MSEYKELAKAGKLTHVSPEDAIKRSRDRLSAEAQSLRGVVVGALCESGVSMPMAEWLAQKVAQGDDRQVMPKVAMTAAHQLREATVEIARLRRLLSIDRKVTDLQARRLLEAAPGSRDEVRGVGLWMHPENGLFVVQLRCVVGLDPWQLSYSASDSQVRRFADQCLGNVTDPKRIDHAIRDAIDQHTPEKVARRIAGLDGEPPLNWA